LSETDSSTFDDLVKQSTVIFRGTITHPRNKGLVRVDSTEETAVVHVDTVYYLRGGGMKLDGQDIALKAQEVSEADVGKPMVFFAKSWLYGASVALAEVGRIPGDSKFAAKPQIVESLQRVKNNRILYRISLANLIVIGKVSDVDSADELSDLPPSAREALKFATIQIDSVEKGQYTSKSVKVLFPQSAEPRWRMPRYHRGQEGIWLLQRNQTERKGPLYGIPAYTALDSDDFHPKDEVEEMRALIRRSW
jgi:hypothetical protein